MKTIGNTYTVFFLASLLLLFVSCQPKTYKQDQNQDENQTEEVSLNADTATELEVPEYTDDYEIAEFSIREATDDELREYGLVVQITDGIYPMFVVTIEFPERQMKQDFDLNIENISLDVHGLYELQDTYISFYYLAELENDLFDIQINNKSLLETETPNTDEYDYVIGTLEGALTESGDLPSEVSVVDEDDQQFRFKCYITPELIKANNQEVTAFYSVRGVEMITYIMPSEE